MPDTGQRSHLTLLLIDPDAGVRESLSDQLRAEGFAILSAARIEEDAAAAPSLILLGPGALDAVALAGWRPAAPVIALVDPGQ